MSITVQHKPGTCSTIFHSITGAASSTVAWVGRTIHSIGSTAAEYARKTAEYAKPHFARLKDFARENRSQLLVAALATTLGALGYAIVSSLFSNRVEASTTIEKTTTITATEV